MTQPILFQGKYDLNITHVRQVLNVDVTDGSRHQDQVFHEIISQATWDNLIVAIQYTEGVICDLRGPERRNTETTPDLVITAKWGQYLETFTSVYATNAAGQAFLDKYLPLCLIQEQCQSCHKTLVGDEALRNCCICKNCESK